MSPCRAPFGLSIYRPGPRINSALIKALARAHRWQRMLENGECGSITELAAAEKIDRSYLCRVLRLRLLAPEIVEAIMDGRQPEGMTLPALMKGFPMEWKDKRADTSIHPGPSGDRPHHCKKPSSVR